MKLFNYMYQLCCKRPFTLPAIFIISLILMAATTPPTPTNHETAVVHNNHQIWLPIIMQAEEEIEEPIPGCYREVNGLIFAEIESVPLVDQWALETDLEGYTGTGYYTWRGPDLFLSPGHGILTYVLDITTPGLYNMRIHNRHDFIDPTEENDIFTRINGGEWVKTFSWQNLEWTYTTGLEYPNHHFDLAPSYHLEAGRHTFEISARSHGFSIDHILFFHQSLYGAEPNPDWTETPLCYDTPDPDPDPDPTTACYQEIDGLLYGEIEAAPLIEEWAAETNLNGFTGDSYYTWRGDPIATPGHAILTYELDITNAGQYQIRIHNQYDHPDPNQQNDVFTRLNGGDWVRTFSLNNQGWNYSTGFAYANDIIDLAPSYTLASGRHTFEIAARSPGFSIDHFVLFTQGSNPDPNWTESPRCVD